MELFDLFFTTRIQQKYRYSSFTPQHFILLAAVSALILFSALYIRKKSADAREKALLYLAWAVPCVYLLRFAVFLLLDIYVEKQMDILDRLPFHLCALNAAVMPAAVTSKNRVLLNYMHSVSLPAAFAAMITPAMSYYGRYAWFSWQILSFFFDHGLMCAVSVLAVCGGAMRPDIKTMPRVLGLFTAYAAVIYPVNKLLGQNYLFLNYPDVGTVMAFFAGFMGNPGYLAAMAFITVITMLLMYLPWFIGDIGQKRLGGG